MLTSLFYYGHYKPYIIKNAGGVSEAPKPAKIVEKSPSDQSADASFLLNKSFKADVLKYARNVSSFVVGTKDTAKNLMIDMENFNKNAFNKGLNTAKGWVADGLSQFVDMYNDSTEFLFSQSHSDTLRLFGEDLVRNLEDNGGGLSSLGVTFDESGKLSFNEGLFQGLGQNAVNVAIGENMNLFQTIYDDASDVLRQPLTEHMKFKSLSYYYNYKYGSIQADTFKIIESGMLVDEVV